MDAVDATIESILDPSIRWGFYRDRHRTPQVHSRSVAGFPFDIIYILIDERSTSWPTRTSGGCPATGVIASRADRA